MALPCGRAMRFSGWHGGWNYDELCPLFGSHCNARKILYKIFIGTVHVRISIGINWVCLVSFNLTDCPNTFFKLPYHRCEYCFEALQQFLCFRLPSNAQVPVPWDLTVHFRGNSSLTKDLLPFSALIEDYRN